MFNLRTITGRSVRVLVLGALVLGLSSLIAAQNPPEQRFTFNVGGGVSPLTGGISDRLNTGWHMTGGAAYNVSAPFSIGAQFLYNGFGVNRGVLSTVGVPGGDARIWAITANPKLTFGTARGFAPYIVGGVGFYRRSVDFTEPALLPVTLFDPFFGFLTGAVPGSRVVSSVSHNGIGGNLGGGFETGRLGGPNGPRIFVEGRYHYADTGSVPTRMIPVTFGLQF